MIALLDGVITTGYDHGPAAQDGAYQNTLPELKILQRDSGEIIMFFLDYEFKRLC